MEKQVILLQIGTDSKTESVYFWRSKIVWIPVLFHNLKILILESQDDFNWRTPLEITWSKDLLTARQTCTWDQVVKGQIQLSLELCPPRVEVQQYLQATCFVSLWIGEQCILQVPHKNLIAHWDVQIPNVQVYQAVKCHSSDFAHLFLLKPHFLHGREGEKESPSYLYYGFERPEDQEISICYANVHFVYLLFLNYCWVWNTDWFCCYLSRLFFLWHCSFQLFQVSSGFQF